MIFISVIHDMVDQLTQTKVIKYLFSCKYIRFIDKIQYLNENKNITLHKSVTAAGENNRQREIKFLTSLLEEG